MPKIEQFIMTGYYDAEHAERHPRTMEFMGWHLCDKGMLKFQLAAFSNLTHLDLSCLAYLPSV
jgi:hypothetical protein